jgi:hypothetical protein
LKFIIDDNLKKRKQNKTIVFLNYVAFRITNKIERILTSTQMVIEIVILFEE